MSQQDIKAVIFDIDGTLSQKNSWWELAEGFGATKEESIGIYEDNLSGKLTQPEAGARVLEMWTRKGPVSKEKFTKILSAIPLRDESLEVAGYLKSKGMLICPITGSNEIYAELVAKKIGADDFYANAKLFWDDKGNLKDFSYEINQSDIKLKQFHEFCQKFNLKPEECIPVGDSYNDYELFRITGRGIAIRTQYEDKVLEELAWKVVNNLSEIKEIIK